jgi:enoyl-CoA hydratase/carnithine racemase
MPFQNIIWETKDQVATLFLNRPEILNALDESMREDLKKALSIAASDEKTRVVILIGKGRAFCAGADLSRFKKDYEHFERTGEPSQFYDITLPRIFASFPKPLIAAINGPAVGVGMTMVLACDIRLASESATFSCPFSRIGLTPEFGSSYHLPRLVGYARAAEWIMTGITVNAQEALSTGLINYLVAPEALLEEARKMAHGIAFMPQEAIDAAKRLLRQGLDSSLNETLERETKIFQDCQKTRSHYLAVCDSLKRMKVKK